MGTFKYLGSEYISDDVLRTSEYNISPQVRRQLKRYSISLQVVRHRGIHFGNYPLGVKVTRVFYIIEAGNRSVHKFRVTAQNNSDLKSSLKKCKKYLLDKGVRVKVSTWYCELGFPTWIPFSDEYWL